MAADRGPDEVAALFDGLPPGDLADDRAMAATLSRILGASIADRSLLRDDRVMSYLDRLAAGLPPGDPLVLIAEFTRWAMRYMQAIMARDTEHADAALREMTGRAGLVPAGHPFRPFVLYGVATAYIERHSINGELRNLELAEAAVNEALAEAAPGGPFAPGTQLHGFLAYLRGHLRMVWNVYEPALPRVTAAIEDLEQAVAEIGPEQASRLDLTSPLQTARIMRAELTEPSGPGRPLGPTVSAAFERLRGEAGRMGHSRAEYPVLAAQAAAGLVLRGLSATDVTLVDQAIALLAEASAIPLLGLRERPRVLQLHGEALHTRYTMTRNARDLSNAIGLLEEARRAVEQEPGSPLASGVLQSLASAYRSRSNQALGDVDRAVRIGLAALREHAGDVLLQDSDDNALHVARRGISDATEMARWFLARGRREAAIAAIELGRGMVLHAATVGSGVAEALTAAGHPELAAEWAGRAGRAGRAGETGEPGAGRPSGDAGPGDDLRYRAMMALEGTPAEAALLSPPTVGDITAALGRGGADALVYLLPQDDSGPGMAVLVDRAGTIGWFPLPQLRVGDASMVGRFLRSRRAVERAAADAAANAAVDADAADRAVAAARAVWLDTLDAVCDWAWEAAVRPLLRDVPGHGPPRIVLVPAGELGLVPWHAARRRQGGSPPRYACQDAVFSYASSARHFIAASRRRVRPWPQAPVLVSDADGSLVCTSAEVAHLHAAHYAGSAVFGFARSSLAARVPGAAGASRDDVLAALPHGSSPGASLLHFGCHGRVGVPALGSSLKLGTGEAGGEVIVSVRDILRQARAGAAPADGGLVVLASCLTDVTEADYDEALTLATAFLAAGSTGVVAARWAVSDAETALFMTAFHQFLNGRPADPAHALREAQLWMLDPGREVPASWPRVLRDEASLTGLPDGPSLAGIEAWAGFTYQGR